MVGDMFKDCQRHVALDANLRVMGLSTSKTFNAVQFQDTCHSGCNAASVNKSASAQYKAPMATEHKSAHPAVTAVQPVKQYARDIDSPSTCRLDHNHLAMPVVQLSQEVSR